jgi:hypothetical protein
MTRSINNSQTFEALTETAALFLNKQAFMEILEKSGLIDSYVALLKEGISKEWPPVESQVSETFRTQLPESLYASTLITGMMSIFSNDVGPFSKTFISEWVVWLLIDKRIDSLPLADGRGRRRKTDWIHVAIKAFELFRANNFRNGFPGIKEVANSLQVSEETVRRAYQRRGLNSWSEVRAHILPPPPPLLATRAFTKATK